MPDYRLPPDVLEKEIEAICRLGVEIRYNSPLGPDLCVEDLFAKGYQAVYLALGLHQGLTLGVSGEDSDGVVQGIQLLKEINLGQRSLACKSAAVIGGGNVAMDAARSLVRLGVKDVRVFYRRTREEMPAWDEEIEAALEEGVKIEYLVAPVEVLTHGDKAAGLRLIRMELGEPDESGRRRPVPIVGSEFDLELDLIVPAIGQALDARPLQDTRGLTFTKRGGLEVDPITCATRRPGIFAGGDMYPHPLGAKVGWGMAIGAVAAGREAADSIARFIEGRDLSEGRISPDNEPESAWRAIPAREKPRPRMAGTHRAPAERINGFEEVDLPLDLEAAQAEAARCLSCGLCCECYQCVNACKAGAVTRETHAELDRVADYRIGAMILAPGAEAYDPAGLTNYLYGQHQSVVTAQEFERLLSSGGPTLGHLVRPGDHSEPKKIAWIQCVGSRDINRAEHGYCSSVCCMYAVKEALIAKDHSQGGLDCAIFYMDMRTFGKDFEKYYDKARAEGVRFVRSRVHSIDPDPKGEDQSLTIQYLAENGRPTLETFDLVVLSQGLCAPKETLDLAARLGVDINKHRFARTAPFAPVSTSVPGVYACGIFTGPKDIPSSVVEASAAACAAGVEISAGRNTLARTLHLPEERDISTEEPRVGVFVCNCGV